LHAKNPLFATSIFLPQQLFKEPEMTHEPNFFEQNPDQASVVRGSPDPAHTPDRRSPEASGAPPLRKPSKLDAEGKNKVCAMLEVGGTLEMAADHAGCTARAIRYAADRDLAFRRRIQQSRERTSYQSLKTMSEAGADLEHWRCAFYHARMVYPERYNRPPNTLHVKQARKLIDQAVDSAIAKTFGVIETTVTDPQLRENIHRGLKQAFNRKRRRRK
jgi:hypothetical protein